MKTFFVSSTFKDMHFERDAIREITLPRLNALAREYGESVSFCDLRWGIDTSDMSEEVSSDKVIRVCLDEIDRCKPPLVVILGERYGWIPDKELVRGVADYKHFVLDDLEKSVTALEVEYGAMSEDRRFEHTLVYFRQLDNPPDEYKAEDEEHKRKLDELKERVKKLPNSTVKEYRAHWDGKALVGADEFARMLSDDLYKLMRPEWERNAEATPFERERYIQNKYVEEKSEYYSGRERVIEELVLGIKEGKRLTIIKGASGTGKSTLFSALAMRLKAEGWETLPFIAGYTRESNDATDIIRNTIKYLELKLKKERKDDTGGDTDTLRTSSVDELQNTLASLASEYVKGGERLVIMVDGVEKLYADEIRDKLRFVPENLSENLRFVITASDSFKTVGIDYYTLGALERDEIVPVIRGMLKRYSRELDASVIEEIASVEEAKNPLYLSLLIKRLIMMNIDDFFKIKSSGDGMSAISKRQKELIAECPKETDTMSTALIWEGARRVNPTLIVPVLEYIALSRFGLRDDDLASLLSDKWSPVDFAHFLSYMSDFFIMRNDGRIDFSHSSTREGVIRECKDRDGILKKLFLHFKGLDEADTVRKSEIIYHAVLCGEGDFVVDYVGKKTTFDILNSSDTYEEDAKSLYSVLRLHGTERIISIIRNAKNVPEAVGFTLFVVGALAQRFTTRQEDIAFATEVMGECYELSKRLEKARVKKAVECRLATSFTYTASLALYDPKQYRSRIKGEIFAGLKEARALYKKEKSPERQEILNLYLNITSTYYASIEGRENTLRAIELFNEAMALSEANAVTERTSLAQLSQLYMRLGDKKSLDIAEEYIDKALSMCEGVSASLYTSFYHIKGLIYLTRGGRQSSEKAIEIYEMAYSYAQKAYAHSGDMTDLSSVLNCRNNLVKTLMDTGKVEYIERILRETEENVRVAELLAKELGTVSSLRELVPYLTNAGQIYQNIGGEENLKKALSYIERSDAVAVEIANRISTKNASIELAVQKAKTAQILCSVNALDNIERASALCLEAVDIGKRLCEEDDFTSDAYAVISFAYSILSLVLANAEKDRENSYLPAIKSGEEAVRYALLHKDAVGSGAMHTVFTAYNNLALIYQMIYQNNIQLSELYTEEYGSREKLDKMICELSKTRPYEQVCIIDVDESIEYTDETDLLLQAIESGNDEDFDLALEKIIGEESENRALADEIYNASRLRAIEYYGEAMKMMEGVDKEDAGLDVLSQLSVIYQNIGALSLLGGENANPTLATEVLQKALDIAEKQHELLGSLTTELGLVRARLSLINALVESEATKKGIALIKDTVKLCEHLNKEWETSETRTNLIAVYNTEIAITMDGGKGAVKGALVTVDKLISLHEKIREDGDTSLDEQYFGALNLKTTLTLMSGALIPIKLMSSANNAYQTIKSLYDCEAISHLKAFYEAVSTCTTLNAQLGLGETADNYYMLVDLCKTADAISEYYLAHDVSEPPEEDIARRSAYIQAIMLITQNPLCEKEELENYLIDGFYTSKLIYDIYRDNEDAKGIADLFFAYAELRFNEIEGGAERYAEMIGDIFEDGDDEGDGEETDTPDDTDFDINGLFDF